MRAVAISLAAGLCACAAVAINQQLPLLQAPSRQQQQQQLVVDGGQQNLGLPPSSQQEREDSIPVGSSVRPPAAETHKHVIDPHDKPWAPTMKDHVQVKQRPQHPPSYPLSSFQVLDLSSLNIREILAAGQLPGLDNPIPEREDSSKPWHSEPHGKAALRGGEEKIPHDEEHIETQELLRSSAGEASRLDVGRDALQYFSFSSLVERSFNIQRLLSDPEGNFTLFLPVDFIPRPPSRSVMSSADDAKTRAHDGISQTMIHRETTSKVLAEGRRSQKNENLLSAVVEWFRSLLVSFQALEDRLYGFAERPNSHHHYLHHQRNGNRDSSDYQSYWTSRISKHYSRIASEESARQYEDMIAAFNSRRASEYSRRLSKMSNRLQGPLVRDDDRVTIEDIENLLKGHIVVGEALAPEQLALRRKLTAAAGNELDVRDQDGGQHHHPSLGFKLNNHIRTLGPAIRARNGWIYLISTKIYAAKYSM